MRERTHADDVDARGRDVGDGVERDAAAGLDDRAAADHLDAGTELVEVDRLDQIEPVLASGEVDTIMLDNFDPDQLRSGVEMVGGRATVEASGGITLDTIADVAATGVDVISVGALTHSVRALDLALDVRVATVRVPGKGGNGFSP